MISALNFRVIETFTVNKETNDDDKRPDVQVNVLLPELPKYDLQRELHAQITKTLLGEPIEPQLLTSDTMHSCSSEWEVKSKQLRRNKKIKIGIKVPVSVSPYEFAERLHAKLETVLLGKQATFNQKNI